MISPGSRSFRNPVSSIISGQSLFRGGTYFYRCLAVDAKVPLLVTNTQSSAFLDGADIEELCR